MTDPSEFGVLEDEQFGASPVEFPSRLPAVGSLDVDTVVEQVDEGRWRARLSEEWNVWGPNGGYVASVCLRAAGAASGLARPATVACQYLAVGAFDDVDLDVEVLRATRRTAAVRVHMAQKGTSLAEATVWAVADQLDGYVWNDARSPVDSSPTDTPSMEDRLRDDPLAPRSQHAMARNLEQRPVIWRSQEALADFTGGRHEALTWMKFVPTAAFDDPWVDACRSLVMVDTWAWPAAVGGLGAADRARFLAPNLDVTARFHADASGSDWLLVESRAPIAGSGLIGTEVYVWTEQGQLVASGGAQLLCRPGPTSPSS